MPFKNYESQPIIRKAHQITSMSEIMACAAPNTLVLVLDGAKYVFKHYQSVAVGDWVVYLDENDIYHVADKIFRERNIVDD